MGSISVPVALTIAAGVSAAGTAVTMVAQHQTAIAQHDDALRRANQAKLESGQKAIEIRQNMLRALATQNAAAGQAGIGSGGSFGANVKRQLTQNQNDLLALNANTSAQVQQYDSQAAAATAQGNIAMGKSLLDSAPGIASNIYGATQTAGLAPITVTAQPMG